MAELIEKLTSTIYREGIEKARNEAKTILDDARKEKESIVNEGSKEVERMIAGARIMAEDLRKKSDAEISMASRKALATLRQRIEEMITVDLSRKAAQELVDDKQFLKKIIDKIIDKWQVSDHTSESLIIKLPAGDVNNLSKYFAEKAKKTLRSKLIFKPDERVNAGFCIEEMKGKFKVGFTDKDFEEFFRFFLRPRLKQFLFGAHKD